MAVVMALVAMVAFVVVAGAGAAAPLALASRSKKWGEPKRLVMGNGVGGDLENLFYLDGPRASEAGQEVLKNPPVPLCVGLFDERKRGWRVETAWLLSKLQL